MFSTDVIELCDGKEGKEPVIVGVVQRDEEDA